MLRLSLYATLFCAIIMGCGNQKQPLFTRMSPDETGIEFMNTNEEGEDQNILAYEYFYNGGGVALGDINNDGLTDIYFSSNQGDNKLYLNKGNFHFEDITEKAGVATKGGWKTGVTMVDINEDGLLDIYVCRSGNHHPLFRQNMLYVNNGDLTFKNQTHVFGLEDDSYSTQSCFFDFDRDGDLDMFLLNHSRLQISNSFDVSRRYGNTRERYVGNKLYRNDGGKYKDVSDSLGIYGPASNYGLGVTTADFNGDGWPDLYVTNDYTERDKLLINAKGKMFYDVGDSTFTHMSQFSMGVDVGDVNNDGLDDLITLDMLPAGNQRQKELHWPDKYDVYENMVKNGRHHQYMRNMLQINNGDGTFSEVGQLAGISNTDWSWAALFADLDLDGFQDIIVTNGFKRNFTDNDFLRYAADQQLKVSRAQSVDKLEDILDRIPPNKAHNYYFQNRGNLTFEDRSLVDGLADENLSNGAAYADLDNDGDLDLVLNNIDEPAGIYRNNAEQSGNHYLKVKLEGIHNKAGIGASVTVYVQGIKQHRYVQPVKGFQSSVEPVLTFGLAKNSIVDSLQVVWPTGSRSIVYNVKVNETLILHENDAKNQAVNTLPIRKWFTEIKKSGLSFKHQENEFIDFKVQSLLPRMYSTQGPAMAIGNYVKDEYPDVYVGGAKGQAGEIFKGNKTETFAALNEPVLEKNKSAEEVDAIFFDMDNDGDDDLYVVTGGYEYEEDDPLLQDHLYKNDGGHLVEVPLPVSRVSGSCVRVADVDKDNDLDLFVGGRLVPGNYPQSPGSQLLVNDGKGTFTLAAAPVLPQLGMVTDAAWTDLNNDSWADLVVVGEWMPVTILINEKGTFKNKSKEFISQQLMGWWNCIEVADFNHDGKTDMVVGNFGMNNQFKATPEHPTELFALDIDSNGSIDPVMTYYIEGQASLMPTRDELVEQVPSLKKKFPDYHSYSTATIKEVLTESQLEQALKLKATTMKTTYLQQTDKGFEVLELPLPIQQAPVFDVLAMDINGDGHLDIVSTGNLSACRPRFGRASANTTSVLLGDGKGGFKYVTPAQTGTPGFSDGRKIQSLGKLVLIGTNDDNLKVFRLVE